MDFESKKIWRYGDDVDTDVIIPARYLAIADWNELAEHAMEDIDTTFAPNVKAGEIMVAGKNFGCGSSREHAPWALADYGFKVMIAPSFADIFYNNSLNNHMLPIRLSEEEVEEIFQWVWANEGKQIHVDLEAMTVTVGDKVYHFELDEFRRHCLLNGLDNIGLTLQHEDAISEYEKNIPAFLR